MTAPLKTSELPAEVAGQSSRAVTCYVFLDCGGLMHKISVCGKIYEFEMHPYCGPTLLNRKGEPLKNQPLAFLFAASLWAKQGQRIENGLCRWDHDREQVLVHLGGKHYKVVDFTEPQRGE